MARGRRRLACVTAAIAVFVIASPAAAAPGDVITIQDAALTTSGSLAADVDRGVYWTAKPDGDGGGVVHALNPDGSTAGEVRFDAAPSHVEALSFSNGQLYVGDVGDPSRNRDSVTVYRLDSLDYGTTTSFTQWTLHYPDGPHDAATMMVSPRGNIWVVTKDAAAGLYYAQAPTGPGDHTLMREADAPKWVTDGTFTGPTTVVLRTYTGLMTFDMSSYTVTAQESAPDQPQGESVTSALDGQGMLLGSKMDDRLIEAAAPTTMQQLPAAPSLPPGASASAAPEPSETAPASPTPTGPPQTPAEPLRAVPSKTRTALGIAAVVSVGAGLLVYWRTRPRTR